MAAEAGTGIRPLGAADPPAVGPYRLIGRLGSGGMGTVFAGVDQFERRVAIKIVHAQFADDREFRTRFTREVAMLRRVGGTCTTPVLDADVEAAQPWFACEYVPGPTLQERIERNGPMHGDELFGLAAGLAEALVALHGVGIVHRDLKPQNVVCSPAGPRVLDLGIARSMEDSGLTRTGMMIGSPAWMSPERFRGQNSTPAADVYAWAMMVAYAATGVIPFGTGSPEVVALRVLQEEPDTSGVPQVLRAIVDAGSDKDPLRRPNAHDVLASVTQTWRGALGASGAPRVDPVADATSLIHMHWKGSAEDASWGGGTAWGQSAGNASGYVPAQPGPQAPSGYPQAPYPAESHAASGYSPSPAAPPHAAHPLSHSEAMRAPVPPPPAPQPAASGGYPAYSGGYGAPGTVPAPRGDDSVIEIGRAEPPPTGRRRAAGGGGRRSRTPLIAAVAALAVVAGTVAVVLAMRGGGEKDKDQPSAAPPAAEVTPPGTVAGPGTYDLAGLKLRVPSGWDARPTGSDSVCLAPLELPREVRTDCLRGGLRVWVGSAPESKMAIGTPDGWALGAPVACPGVSATGKPQGHTAGTQYPKLGDLTYEYAQYTVTCPDNTTIEPQVWWLPKSKISFSTGGLPKKYDPSVKQVIVGIDKTNYKAP